ncbi:recombinase family protein [Paeniglutamicibacter sp. ORCA_105]|uniref:recombinase family protein n=1 Tax=Paeniglutamicibacter sp. ORCA_105 TaxID=3377336 RepID=UPI0038944438
MEYRKNYFRSHTERIVTTGLMSKARLTVISAFAQLERDQLAERTRAGKALRVTSRTRDKSSRRPTRRWPCNGDGL